MKFINHLNESVLTKAEAISELQELGISGLQFANYEDGVFSITRDCDPEQGAQSWINRLRNNGWTNVSNANYPRNDSPDYAPHYSVPTIFSADDWYCLIFKRYGYSFDGITVWFKKEL